MPAGRGDIDGTAIFRSHENKTIGGEIIAGNLQRAATDGLGDGQFGAAQGKIPESGGEPGAFARREHW